MPALISKLHVGIAAFIAAMMVMGLAWTARKNADLRAEAARQAAVEDTRISALEQKAAAQSQRAAAADERLAGLLREVEQARHGPPPDAAAANAPVEAAEALKACVARASQLLNEGKSQEAVDEYVRCYREQQALRPGSSECQSLMSSLKTLGRSFPPALTALAELRDSAAAQFQANPSHQILAFEIALLNERLGEGSLTVAVYDALPPDSIYRPSLARIAIRSFIEAQRYHEALSGRQFSAMLSALEASARNIPQRDISRQPALRQSSIKQAATDIEVLVGAGQETDARLLTEKLLAFDDSMATRALIQQHTDRAQSMKP